MYYAAGIFEVLVVCLGVTMIIINRKNTELTLKLSLLLIASTALMISSSALVIVQQKIGFIANLLIWPGFIGMVYVLDKSKISFNKGDQICSRQ